MGFFSFLFGKDRKEEVHNFNAADPVLQDLYRRNMITAYDFNYYNSPMMSEKQMYEDLFYNHRISEYDIPAMYRSEVVSNASYHSSHEPDETDPWHTSEETASPDCQEESLDSRHNVEEEEEPVVYAQDEEYRYYRPQYPSRFTDDDEDDDR